LKSSPGESGYEKDASLTGKIKLAAIEYKYRKDPPLNLFYASTKNVRSTSRHGTLTTYYLPYL
jgi:hypothetical protein